MYFYLFNLSEELVEELQLAFLKACLFQGVREEAVKPLFLLIPLEVADGRKMGARLTALYSDPLPGHHVCNGLRIAGGVENGT